MGIVSVSVGDRQYQLSCMDGDEPRLRELAALVDTKAKEALDIVGRNTTEARQLLFAALLLADQLSNDGERSSAGPSITASDGITTDQILPFIERLERLASTMERSPH